MGESGSCEEGGREVAWKLPSAFPKRRLLVGFGPSRIASSTHLEAPLTLPACGRMDGWMDVDHNERVCVYVYHILTRVPLPSLLFVFDFSRQKETASYV